MGVETSFSASWVREGGARELVELYCSVLASVASLRLGRARTTGGASRSPGV